MKKILLYHLIFLFILSNTNAQTFIKSYEAAYGSGGSITSTKDGGFIRSATFMSDQRTYIIIIKTNATGNVQWSKKWGPVTSTSVSNIVQTTDGGYAVSGSGNDGTRNGMMLLKLNSAGNMQWVKYYASNIESYSKVLQQTLDGGYIFVGVQVRTVIDYEQRRACVVKTDSTGSLVWSKLIFNFSRYASSIEDIALAKEGGFILVGQNGSTKANIHCYLMKLKSNGTLEWTKVMPQSNENKFNFVKPLKEGSYLLGGYISGSEHRSDMFIAKVNQSGVFLWSKIIMSQDTKSRAEEFNDAIEIPGGYVAVGYTDSSESISSLEKSVLARFSENGKLLGSALLTAPDVTYATSISSYTSAGFAVALSEYINAEKIYIAKFNKVGSICGALKNFGVGKDTAVVFTNGTVSITNLNNLQVTSSLVQTVSFSITATNICNGAVSSSEANAEQQISASGIEDAGIFVSPNPVANTLYLKWTCAKQGGTSIEIFSAAGKKMYEKKLDSFKGNNNIAVAVNNFAKGIYLLKLKSGTDIKTVKFVKE